jgi:hypothetical protein
MHILLTLIWFCQQVVAIMAGSRHVRLLIQIDHSIDYFSSDITQGGLDDTEVTLDTDFLYFDPKRDADLAKVLQRMAKQDEVKQRSSTKLFEQWNIAPSC